jgi:uncharacterized repeat protein (TIGR01451 family)
MKKQILNTIKRKFLFLLGIVFLGSFLYHGISFASNFNQGASDFPLRVGNATQSSGTLNWGTSLSGVNPGDHLKFQVYYHNAGSSSANNSKVTLRLTPSGSSTNFQAESQISASGYNTHISNANISLNKAQSINLKTNAKWYHNFDGSNYQIDDVIVSVSGNTATFNLGSVAPGYAPNDGYIVFEGAVSGSTSSTSNNFNTNALDHPLRVGNVTQSSGTLNWGTSLSGVNPGDQLKFQVYYHNAGNSSASNSKVTLRLTPSGSSTNFQAESQISASGYNTHISNANISLNKAQSINLKTNAKWYHNFDGSNYQIDDVIVSVSGNTATFNLGSVAPGYAPNDGYIVFEGAVSGSTSSTSNNFNTNALDHPLRVGNATQSSGSSLWEKSISNINEGDEVKFSIYYHNPSNISANNTKATLKITPSGSSTNFQAESQISASGFNTYTSNVSLSLNKAQSINLKTNAKWYHNFDGSNYQIDDVTVFVSGNTATFDLGTVNPGYAPNDGYLIISALIGGQAVQKTIKANAGNNQEVVSGDFVRLNGLNSIGTNLTYAWACDKGINLDNYSIATPSFIAPEVTYQESYICTLTVKSGSDYSNDSIKITVNPKKTLATTGTALGEITSIKENNNGAVALYAKINECTDKNCKARFIWGTDETVQNQTKWIENLKKGDEFSYPLINLEKGKPHYTGLEIQMGSLTFKTKASDLTKFITTPDKPASFSAQLKNNTNVVLSWKKGEGGNKVLIRRNINICPDISDLTSDTIYLGEGLTFEDASLTPNTSYCYRAWMITSDGTYSAPAEITISTKAKTTTTTPVYIPQTSTIQTATKQAEKEFSLESTLRNISLNETQFRKNITASAGDNIEFLIEVKNTGKDKLENIVVKNLVNPDLTIKNVFINNENRSLDSLEHAFLKELKKDEIFRVNFTATLNEYESEGSMVLITEASADNLSPLLDTVNIQKKPLEKDIDDDSVKASFFANIMAGGWVPWSILILIVLALLIVYFSFKEERRK